MEKIIVNGAFIISQDDLNTGRDAFAKELDRLSVCWNALAGIEDPEAFVKAALKLREESSPSDEFGQLARAIQAFDKAVGTEPERKFKTPEG